MGAFRSLGPTPRSIINWVFNGVPTDCNRAVYTGYNLTLTQTPTGRFAHIGNDPLFWDNQKACVKFLVNDKDPWLDYYNCVFWNLWDNGRIDYYTSMSHAEPNILMVKFVPMGQTTGVEYRIDARKRAEICWHYQPNRRHFVLNHCDGTLLDVKQPTNQYVDILAFM